MKLASYLPTTLAVSTTNDKSHRAASFEFRSCKVNETSDTKRIKRRLGQRGCLINDCVLFE
ncbi:hypothetical protein HDG38_000171 [Paraburkholderia sp. WSM4177]|nr:hypothetical protein [Paraburkholderia sp. WSM4177]MBB5481977.1 hypothetical protein [Paraburkholderia sp. WSM4180]